MSRFSKILKIASICLAAAFFLYVPLFVIPKIGGGADTEKPGQRGIVELWHVENFDGGSASRVDWLKGRSKEFESKNKGVYVHVTLYTLEQVLAAIANGQHFDLLSFSAGFGTEILSSLREYQGALNTSDNYTAGGAFEGRQYAVPYMAGGYFLFGSDENADLLETLFDKPEKKNASSFACGYGLANSPLTALALNAKSLMPASSKIDIAEGNTQFTAYERFIRGECQILLGTQRDQFRLTNRIQTGKLESLKAQPLGGFTDLVQYIALSAGSGEMLGMAQNFIEYLTSDAVQAKLTRCNMLSVCAIGISVAADAEELEKALSGAKTVNVFSTGAALAALRNQSVECLLNGQKKDVLFFLTSGGMLP